MRLEIPLSPSYTRGISVSGGLFIMMSVGSVGGPGCEGLASDGGRETGGSGQSSIPAPTRRSEFPLGAGAPPTRAGTQPQPTEDAAQRLGVSREAIEQLNAYGYGPEHMRPLAQRSDSSKIVDALLEHHPRLFSAGFRQWDLTNAALVAGARAITVLGRRHEALMSQGYAADQLARFGLAFEPELLELLAIFPALTEEYGPQGVFNLASAAIGTVEGPVDRLYRALDALRTS